MCFREKGKLGCLNLVAWSKYGEWRYMWWIVLCHIRWVTICFANHSLLRFGEWRRRVISLPKESLKRRSTNFLKTFWLLVFLSNISGFDILEVWVCFLSGCDNLEWFFWSTLVCSFLFNEFTDDISDRFMT